MEGKRRKEMNLAQEVDDAGHVGREARVFRRREARSPSVGTCPFDES